jgi:prepilin-type N-terminal cleavage/methylation domain-containing protein/prepilin-type processing-associated H-X9-DG protein
MTRSKQLGFTLVELLVVIAIIGILVALLLPAVQAAREAARRMQCSNNLKQLALACHNYHDTYKQFPPGWVWQRGFSHYNDWGWGALVLPFVEQQPLHDEIEVGRLTLDQSADPAIGNHRDTMRVPLAAYSCPSDIAPVVNTFRAQHPFAAGSNTPGLATSNYVGANSAFWLDVLPTMSNEYAGVFEGRHGKAFRSLTDGTSNIALIGERRWERIRKDNGQIGTCGAGVVFGIRTPGYPPYSWFDTVGIGRIKINYDWDDDLNASAGFSSLHPGGTQFALADGSVRFVSETIEHDLDATLQVSLGPPLTPHSPSYVDTTFERLLAIGDGQPVGDF